MAQTAKTATPASRLRPKERKELKALVARVREARAARGMGSRELSLAANLSTGTVSAIECGHVQRVELLTLNRLADALKVSRAWLATGAGSMDVEEAAGSAENSGDSTEIVEISPQNEVSLAGDDLGGESPSKPPRESHTYESI